MKTTLRTTALVLLVAVRPCMADDTTTESIENLKRECQANQEGCSALFGSVAATLMSPTDFMIGATLSDPDVSSESLNSIVKNLDRARPDAAEFLQSNGASARTPVLAETMQKLKTAFPQFEDASDLELAELIVFGMPTEVADQQAG